MTWHECETFNTPPLPCYGHSGTKIDDQRILYFGGKGYKVLNSIHILDIINMTWNEYLYSGNVLSPRWGHSATLMDNTIVLYGGRDLYSCLSSIDIINLDDQLIPKQRDISAKEAIQIKQTQKKNGLGKHNIITKISE